MSAKIICPYVDEREILKTRSDFWNLDVHYEQDAGGIGSDLMYQKMWNKFPNDDIIIIHADMSPLEDDPDNTWYEKLCASAINNVHAGMIGCVLLYPAKDKKQNFYIQNAGGKFDEKNGNPTHIGSGIDIDTQGVWGKPVLDQGQFEETREVAWNTFGGLYIKREVLNKVGNFAPEFEWTYNRDVDYCLQARVAGFKILQVPIKLIHHESRDNKRIKARDPLKLEAEMRNLETLKQKWENTKWYRNI